MAILETGHAVDVSTVQSWLAQPSRLAKTLRISLPKKEIGDDTAALLSTLTLQCCNLQVLQLPGNCIGDQGACCLAESLKLLPAPLQILDLSDNCLSGVSAKQLARLFFTAKPGGTGGAMPHCEVKASRFRLLDLSKNKLDDHGVAGVARNIAAGDALAKHTLLSLRDVSCGGQGLSDLARCHLAGLDIGHNALGLDGAKAVLAAGRRNRWQSLRMAQISDDVKSSRPSCSALASSFAECLDTGLRDLECGGNYFGENACCCIAEALSKCSPTLLRLSLPSTGFGLRACGALGQGFWPGAGLSNLKMLDLSGNELVDVSVELLCNGFSRCASLQEVQLSDNVIGSRGCIVLAGALQAQRHLATAPQTGIVLLGLSGNPLGNSGAKAMAAAAAACTQDPRCLPFEASWGLEQLELARTKVGQEGCDALAGAVAARAALAEEASRRLAERSLNQVELQDRWGRRCPAGLTITGLDVCDANVTEMLHTAHRRMVAHWPMANQDSGLAWESEQPAWLGLCQDVDVDHFVHKEAASIENVELEESYFATLHRPGDSKLPQKPAVGERQVPRAAAQEELLVGQAKAAPATEVNTGSMQGRSSPVKGKGKSSPGKGTGPPPKGKGKSSAKGRGKGVGKIGKEAKEADESQAKGAAPFGRRMHWVQPQYRQPEHETVFGDPDAAIDLDTDVLASLLSGTATKMAPKSRAAQQRKAEGIKVLDASRAQNIAIVLSKLPMSSEDVCEALANLEFSRLALSDDIVELLTSVLPTPEEAQKLKIHKDSPENLRDIEQKVLPFCFLPRATARLRLFRFAASHTESASMYLQRCQTLHLAATEARNSQELRRVLAIILRIGNYINHGMKDVSGAAGGACAFSIETLAAITSFRLGNMSTLQFLCVTLRRTNPNFVDALSESLKHVAAAAREKSVHLKSCIRTFLSEVEFAEREVSHMPEDQPSSGATDALLKDLSSEVAELKDSLGKAFSKCEEVQEYFCTSEDRPKDSAPPPYENFFLHLSDFLDSLRKAWKETAPAAPGPSQQAKLQAKPKVRKRRDPSESTRNAAKAGPPICRRAFPDSAPAQKPESPRRTGQQVDAVQEVAPSSLAKQDPFWEMEVDVEALLSDIFATQDERLGLDLETSTGPRDSDCCSSASLDWTKNVKTMSSEASVLLEKAKDNEVHIDVDDLIDSIFD